MNTGVLFSVSSDLANSIFFKDLYAPLKSIITEKYTEFATTNVFKDIFKEVTSDGFAESYTSMTDLIGGFEQIPELEFQKYLKEWKVIRNLLKTSTMLIASMLQEML